MQLPAFDLRSAFRWHRILSFLTGCLAGSFRDCRLCSRLVVKNQMHSLTTHHMYHRLLRAHHCCMCAVLAHPNCPSYLFPPFFFSFVILAKHH
uniref:Secreted protein n=1 Tax=Rhipicephalus zambeziensis TaxID=60191 RepID=A0A224YFP1_9ACAR